MYSKEQLIKAMEVYNENVKNNPENFMSEEEMLKLSSKENAELQINYLISIIDKNTFMVTGEELLQICEKNNIK